MDDLKGRWDSATDTRSGQAISLNSTDTPRGEIFHQPAHNLRPSSLICVNLCSTFLVAAIPRHVQAARSISPHHSWSLSFPIPSDTMLGPNTWISSQCHTGFKIFGEP